MNFEEITNAFVENEAVIQLPELDEDQAVAKLVEVFRELLEDKEKRGTLAQNAQKLMKSSSGATHKTLEYLQPFLNSKKPTKALDNFIK